MRHTFLFILPLLFTGCSLFKAPNSGDFSRVKHLPHLAQQREVVQDPSDDEPDCDATVQGGPAAFREAGVASLQMQKARSVNSEAGESFQARAVSDKKALPDDPSSSELPLEKKAASEPVASKESAPVVHAFPPLQENLRIASQRSVEQVGRTVEAENVGDALLLILCILLPPLPVFMVFGGGTKFVISIVLAVLFWVPGIIYSIYVIGKEKAWF